MGNHYHLLAETPEGNLVAGMKWLQSAYTQRYNSRHKVFGHLFQGRYKAVIVDGQEPMYFQVASTYIHLNPARAGLIRIGDERLKNYHWSSYPWYLDRAGKKPEWVHCARVMGSLGLAEKDCRGYEAYLEGRVLELGSKAGRKELDEQWKALRRGWYVGEESFAEKLREGLKRALQGRRRESHSGSARMAHDQAAAEERLKQALQRLGLDETALEELPKGSPEKLVLAWWLRENTTVTLRWVAQRLGMGHYTRVTKAISRMVGRRGKKLEKIKHQLAALEERQPKLA